MTAATVMMAAFVVLLGGAVLVIPVSRNRVLAGQVACGVTALSSLLAIGAAVSVLASGPGQAVTVWTLPQYASALRIYVDGLSAVFLLLIAVISALSALYSIQYMEHYPDYGLYRYYPYFLLFVAGMYGIVIVTDLMAGFFLLWQLMTVSSYFLVRFDYKHRANVRAANRYLIAMEVACAFILLGAGILAQGSVTLGGETLMRYDFDAISHGMPALLRTGGGQAAAGMLCFLIGFGIKAGVWPFGQWWLPAAHPAAPSPVSALLSGVMIKTGIYGLDALLPLARPGRGGGRVPQRGLGSRHRGPGDGHPLHRHHAGPGAGRVEATPRLQQHRPGGLYSPPPGRLSRADQARANRRRGALPGHHRLLRIPLPHAEPRAVQEPALPERRVAPLRHRDAGPEPDGRPDQISAGHGGHGADRRRSPSQACPCSTALPANGASSSPRSWGARTPPISPCARSWPC